MDSNNSVGPPLLMRFTLTFVSYVAYVLFRRLPMVLLPQMQKEIPLSREDIGQFVSVQALCFTLSKLVFGVASDRISSLRIISFGLALIAVSSVYFGYVSSFYHILFAVASIGSLQGASWVPATKLVAKWYSDRAYGKMFSILSCGSTAAGLLMPFLVEAYWRNLMICCGFITLSYSIFVFFFLRGDDVKPVSPPSKEESSSLVSLTYSPAIWSVSIMYLFSMEVRTVCESWIPIYITENQISLATFQILYEIGGVFGNIGSGALLDYLILRISVDSARRIVGIGSSALLLLVAAFSIKYMEYVATIGLLLGFLVNASINIWCMIASQLGDAHMSGTISAFISFLANFGSVLAGSPLAFLIDNFGYSCFAPFFFTHMALLGAIALINVGLRVKATKQD